MDTRANVEFRAVPWTNNVNLRVIVSTAMNALVGIHVVDHALEDPALTYRSPLVRTHIAPGMKLTVDVKDTDIDTVDRHQLLGIVAEIVDTCNFMLSHLLAPQPLASSQAAHLLRPLVRGQYDPANYHCDARAANL